MSDIMITGVVESLKKLDRFDVQQEKFERECISLEAVKRKDGEWIKTEDVEKLIGELNELIKYI